MADLTDKQRRILYARQQHPEWSPQEIAEAADASERYARDILKEYDSAHLDITDSISLDSSNSSASATGTDDESIGDRLSDAFNEAPKKLSSAVSLQLLSVGFLLLVAYSGSSQTTVNFSLFFVLATWVMVARSLYFDDATVQPLTSTGWTIASLLIPVVIPLIYLTRRAD